MPKSTHFRGLRARVTLAALVAATCVAVPATLAGAIGLTVTEAVLPSNSTSIPFANLNAVTCLSPIRCVAVGHYESTQGGDALIIIKQGVWGAPRPAHLPADALVTTNASFTGVSCVSWGNCVAVGQYESANGYEGFIETERFGTWDPAIKVSLPAKSIASSVTGLNSISCVAIGYCVAVGQLTNSDGNQGLIVTQSNGVWKRGIVSPLPIRSRSNFITQLDGVSCVSWGSCVAVGQFVNTTPTRRGLIVTETKGIWSRATSAPLPLNAHRDAWAGLSSIKCVSLGNCEAVGSFQGSTHSEGLIVGEIHGVWGRGAAAPLPPTLAGSNDALQLTSVTCVSVGNCEAVGQVMNGQQDRGVVITEAKGGWGSAQLTPKAANAVTPYYEELNGVACSLGHCSMVGQYQALNGQPAEIVSTG